MKTYLARLTQVFGIYETNQNILVIIAEEENLQKELYELAKEERGNDDDDYDEQLGGFWFEGNLVKLPVVIRELSEYEANIFSLAGTLSQSICEPESANDTIEKCAQAIEEMNTKAGHEWVKGSLYESIVRYTAATIRKLKN